MILYHLFPPLFRSLRSQKTCIFLKATMSRLSIPMGKSAIIRLAVLQCWTFFFIPSSHMFLLSRSILSVAKLPVVQQGTATSRHIRLGWVTKVACSCDHARHAGTVTTQAERWLARLRRYLLTLLPSLLIMRWHSHFFLLITGHNFNACCRSQGMFFKGVTISPAEWHAVELSNKVFKLSTFVDLIPHRATHWCITMSSVDLCWCDFSSQREWTSRLHCLGWIQTGYQWTQIP